MLDIYPEAQWRPLSNQQTEPVIGIPRILVWHTMVGNLRSTETMFRKDGYSGTESTFGLGGSSDGSLDGVYFQWQRLSRQADAQMSGNAFCTSIECSDGGDSTRPFSQKQVESSIRLGVWWCRQTGRPARKATTWDGVGLGYHRMYPQWTGGPRACPGDKRASQLEHEIWPEIARILNEAAPLVITPAVASVAPAFPLHAGDFYSLTNNSGSGSPEEGLRTWQRQMMHRGWTIAADGRFGSQTDKVTRQFQKEKNLWVDGRIGLQTWNAAWNAKVTS